MIKYLVMAFCLFLAMDVQAQEMPSPGGVKLGSVVPKKLLSDPTPSGKVYTLKLPKPNSFVNAAIVKLNSKGQAIRIVVLGRAHIDDAYGSSCKSEYEDVKQKLIEKYGSPTESLDFLLSDSIWKEPRHFVMSLSKNEYVKTDYWTSSSGFSIDFTMRGINGDNCYNEIGYEHTLLLKEEIVKQNIKEKEGF